MDMVYLQCDMRYNKWLLEKIGDNYVIEYTIDRCKLIRKGKIVAGVYVCPENTELVKILEKRGVIVINTEEENVTKRFLDIVLKEKADYVIRVGGDQCLLDADKTTALIGKMKEESAEWFFERYSASIIPDIVSVDCLRKWKKEIENADRYFKALEKQSDVKRYRLPYPLLILYHFRANSNEGFRVCRNIIMNKLNVDSLSLELLPRLINSKYLVKSGLLGSWILPREIGDFYYDEEQKINPWFGKSMIDLIKKHLNKSLLVFEWGGGNSTLFWSDHVKEVVSVEYDKEWYGKLFKAVPDNVLMKYCELKYDGEYCRSILEEEKRYDIILIDGRDRVRCALNAVLRLKEDGIIIWDDSEREAYRPGIEYLKENGFKQLEISSIGYGSPGTEQFTSIFYRNHNFCGL